MDQQVWDKSGAKILFEALAEVEHRQYLDYQQPKLDQRKKLTEKFILEFGKNTATIQTFTNMMQYSHSVCLDVFQAGGWQEGHLHISWGSEPQELWATNSTKPDQHFDFQKWEWVQDEKISEE